MRISVRSICLLLAMRLVSSGATAVRAAEIQAEPVIYRDPDLRRPGLTRSFDERLVPLWRLALARPETEYQRLASEAVAQAHREGFKVVEAAHPELKKLVAAPQTHHLARFAAAQALIELKQQDAAEALFAAGQKYGPDLRYLVEPALAQWQYKPARGEWRKRLSEATTPRRDLLLAINGCGTVRDQDALPELLTLVHQRRQTSDVRLAAARAAAQIAEQGLEPEAVKLLKPGAVTLDRLCATSLLTKHRSKEAQAILIPLTEDGEGAIATLALRTLFETEPSLVLPLAEKAIRHADAGARQVVVDTWNVRPAVERMPLLATVLNDPHDGVRGSAREGLFRHAQQRDLEPSIRAEVMRVLSQDGWRGQEQATLLLAALDHKSAASRMVELLESERPEVFITAAWGLRELAVPETFAALLNRAERQTEISLKHGVTRSADDKQVVFLMETFGRTRYREAEELMRKYIPKNFALGDDSRAAAIWSLGYLHDGQADETLAADLLGRMLDISSQPPECYPVRYMSAISLGRMKAAAQLPTLKDAVGATVSYDEMDRAWGWAIERISGEQLPTEPAPVSERGGWFLEPYSRPAEPQKNQ